MVDPKLLAKRETLNRELESLKDELAAAPVGARAGIESRIEEIEWAIRDLTLEQRNRASMDGGSEG